MAAGEQQNQQTIPMIDRTWGVLDCGCGCGCPYPPGCP
jgi:hypothetical protein